MMCRLGTSSKTSKHLYTTESVMRLPRFGENYGNKSVFFIAPSVPKRSLGAAKDWYDNTMFSVGGCYCLRVVTSACE